MVALIGGVVLPLAVNASANHASTLLHAAAVLVSVLVGIAVAMESFLRPGERWIQFRQTGELLRSKWWLFVSLAGDDAGYATIADVTSASSSESNRSSAPMSLISLPS